MAPKEAPEVSPTGDQDIHEERKEGRTYNRRCLRDRLTNVNDAGFMENRKLRALTNLFRCFGVCQGDRRGSFGARVT